MKPKYCLRTAMVPCHISVPLADRIFFIGESIQLFEYDRKTEENGNSGVLTEKEVDFYSKLVIASPKKITPFQLVFLDQRALSFPSL